MVTGEQGALELGELRSILQRPASSKTWALLLERLLPAAPPERDTAFWQVLWPYTLSHLSRWPDHLRLAPARLAQAWLRAEQLEFLPLCRHVSFYREDILRDKLGKSKHLRQLFAHPDIAAWRGLELRNYELSPYHLGLLLEAPFKLEQLALNNCKLSGQHLERLLATPSCAELVAFDAEHLLLGDELTLLIDQPNLQGVESLMLGHNRLTHASVNHIEAWASLRPRHLDLGSNPLGSLGDGFMDEGALERLAQAPSLERLESLNISAMGLGHLLRLPRQAPAWSNLRELTLGAEALSRDAFGQLSGCALPSLESLTIRRARQDSHGLDHMGGARWWSTLRHLNLSDNKHDLRSITVLAHTLGHIQLLSLDLSWNPLGDEGARALATSAPFGCLEQLRLRSTGLSDEGALALFEPDALPRLKLLDLRQNELTELDFLEALAAERGLELWL